MKSFLPTPTTSRHLGRWALALCLAVAVLLTSACSRIELVYDNADWLIHRWAVDLLDADAEQKDRWRERFADLLSEHREQLLPETLALLGDIETASRDTLDDSRLHCLFDQVDELYRAHARLAVPVAVGILRELKPEQQGALAQRLAERNKEYADKYLAEDLTERRELRVERYTDRVEGWVGKLSPDQRRMLAVAISEMPDTAEPWLEYRQQQQQRMLALLRRQASEQELTEFLTAWWVDLEQRPPMLVESADGVREQSIALTLQIAASLDQRQRASFSDRVAEWRDDLSSVQTVATTPSLSPRCG